MGLRPFFIAELQKWPCTIEGKSRRQGYTSADYLGDLQAGLWAELRAPRPVVNLCRRKLHRAYHTKLREALQPPSGAGQSAGCISCKPPARSPVPAWPRRRR